MTLTMLKNANLALTFFMELAILAAFGYWGIQTGQGILLKIVLGIGAPAIFVVIWSLFGAPKSVWPLQDLQLLTLRGVLSGIAVIALLTTSHRTLGITFALVTILNIVLLYVWEQ
jgi:Protein of unknown function (DUF2568).